MRTAFLIELWTSDTAVKKKKKYTGVLWNNCREEIGIKHKIGPKRINKMSTKQLYNLEIEVI